jgi:rod shape-determining protein MreD
MRRHVLSAALIAVGLVLQLTLIDRLQLPEGGAPDLVLVLVVTLGLANGPVAGAVTGFAAGLCLDLAPPASQLIGQYALVFCLIGWAAGLASRRAAKSALTAVGVAVGAVICGELLAAGLALALEPAQVSWSSVRQVLPASIVYDLAITPFVLYLVLVAGSWLAQAGKRDPAEGLLAVGFAALPGIGGWQGSAGWLTGPPESRRARKAASRHAPRIGPAANRPGEGWVGGGPRSPLTPTGRRPLTPKLRASRGVAGSAVAAFTAAGGHEGAAARRVAGRRRHAGFRPSAGMPGGSAVARVRQRLPAVPALHFGQARRGDGTVGGGALTAVSARRRQRGPAPRLKFGTGDVAARAGRATRRPAAPRFRLGKFRGGSAQLGGSQISGQGMDIQAFRSLRRSHLASPRLRLGAARRGDAWVGGTLHGRRPVMGSRPAARPKFRASRAGKAREQARKRPKFSRGRRSVLTLLTGWRRGRAGELGVVASRRTGGTA